VASPLDAYLEQWEREHPRAPAIPVRKAMTPKERAQLKALGYLD
jgi:hypothetical protein